MSNITVVGAQWGDEGKGKIVDWLSAEADIVVRFQGGHNAGHTLVIDGTTYKLHALPSGVVRPNTFSVIGNGVVVEPWSLMTEISRLASQGISITPDNLMISEHCPLILPLHGSMDRSLEEMRGNEKIGTTGRGIGPTYADKVGRRVLRMCDLAHPETLHDKLERIAHVHNAIHKGLNTPPIAVAEFVDSLQELSYRILPFIGPSWKVLNEAVKNDKRILFEGAQGIMLDVDHGTYPFVTSSNTVAGQASVGSGLSPKELGYVLGITKAYTTRVGAGPFPTELEDAIGAHLTEKGNEFGTTTGRKRRCGWFDAVQVRQAAAISGLDGMSLMKLDVLDGMKEIKICTGYTYEGHALDYLPASQDIQEKLEPVYETLPGWNKPVEGVRSFDALPDNAKRYIRRIEELVGIPVALVSTGAEREDTVSVVDILAPQKAA